MKKIMEPDLAIQNLEKVKMPFLKRAFDIFGSLLLFVLFSPLIVLILTAMIFEYVFIPSSRGKIFYSETRISAGEPFAIYKFRIFKNSALKANQHNDDFAKTKTLEKNKENLTYVGRILRNIYMDELPQLFNVLKGDMSLVGPRPKPVKDSERLLKEGIYSKYLIKTGLTGLFQSQKAKIFKRSEAELDREYINFCRNNPGWKIVLNDIKIILKTIKPILKAEGI